MIIFYNLNCQSLVSLTNFPIYIESVVIMKFILPLILLLCCMTVFIRHIQAAEKAGVKTPNGKKGPTRSRVTTSREWIQQSLDTHNFFRSLHQKTPPLILNNTLSEISQYYADRLLALTLKTLDGQGRVTPFFDHNPETGNARIGENLYYSIMTAPVDPVPSHYAVALWYEEIKDYDFTTTKRKLTSAPDAKIGHLTQMLWKDTTQMGTAYASIKLKDNHNQLLTFVVANYYPTGNIRGEKYYLKNVLPPTISDADVNAAIVSRNIKGWWKKKETKSDTSESSRKAALKSHNKYRKVHGSQPLRLNKDICRVSQNWADHLLERGLQDFNAYGRVNQIQKNFMGTSLCGLGESAAFFITEDDKFSSEQPIRLWYKQGENYNFVGSQKHIGLKTDGFQQIVWNSTTEFCLSSASSKTEDGQYLTYVVANYYPPMTYTSVDRKNNVFPRGASLLNESGHRSGCSAGAIFLIITLCIVSVIHSSNF